MKLVKPMESIDERVVAYNYECQSAPVSSTSNGNCGGTVSSGDSSSSNSLWELVYQFGYDLALDMFGCK